MINFSSELNPEQLKVVLEGDGPCLVLAGAGSGKTRTITYRVAYLLEKGIKPENILLVTFTNKAAAEMKGRVQKIMGAETAPLPWSGTFHHIGYRLLKQYAQLIGYQNNFTVLDSDDSESLIKLCIKDVKPNDIGQRFPSASAIASVISFSRNAGMSLTKVIEDRFEQWLAWETQINEVARAYERKKKEAQTMDFDDLLTNTLLLLQNDKILQKYSEQFHYILVDEYQDTNKIQAGIIKKLAAVYNNVLVVGDDAQSIYSFRAADIENILNFQKNYPKAKIFKLETNYRSTKSILDVANSVIENNRSQFKKNLHPLNVRVENFQPLPILRPQIDQQTEASFIAKKIEEYIKNGTPETEIAVLFRAAFHSQPLEVELVSRGIAYDYRGGARFFERAHVKDALSYLRVLNNLADTPAWLRVLTHEQGIGPVNAEKIGAAVKNAKNAEDIESIGREILYNKALIGWENFVTIWNALTNEPDRSPATLLTAILTTPYREYLEAEYIDSRDRLADLKQLARFAERYADLDQFLAETTLQESFRSVENKNPQQKIILSTIHQAKGLEWEVVFIINLASGAFPNERASRENNGLEEERRLFYVAITRAKKHLFLTYPMARLHQDYGGQAGGNFGDFLSGPSMFLDEIERGLLEDHSLLLQNSSVFNSNDPEYVSEDEPFPSKPIKIKPGNFLRDLDDL